MHILITLDQNDLPPLRVALHSLFRGNPGEPFEIHMPYDGIPAGQVAALSGRCNRHGSRLLPTPPPFAPPELTGSARTATDGRPLNPAARRQPLQLRPGTLCKTYRMVSGGEKDTDWVLRHTVLLHRSCRVKPWTRPTRGRFGVLCRHYMTLAERDMLWKAGERPAPPEL